MIPEYWIIWRLFVLNLWRVTKQAFPIWRNLISFPLLYAGFSKFQLKMKRLELGDVYQSICSFRSKHVAFRYEHSVSAKYTSLKTLC